MGITQPAPCPAPTRGSSTRGLWIVDDWLLMVVSAFNRSRVRGGVPEPRLRQTLRGVELERFPPLGGRCIDESMNAALRSEQERQSLNFRIPGHLLPEKRIARGRDFERSPPRNPPFLSLDYARYGTERIGPLPRHHDLGDTLRKQQSKQDQKGRL